MFHMLTGSDPQDNPLLIFDFSKNPMPRQINPAITLDMERILVKSVAHKPEDRQLSALDLGRALEEHNARLSNRPPQSSTKFAGSAGPKIGSSQLHGYPSPSGSRASYPPVSTPPVRSSGDVKSSDVQPVFCGHCGEKIGVDDIYCAHCGARQSMVANAAGSPMPTPGRTTAQLEVVGPAHMGKAFAINKDSVLIGRTDPQTGIFPEIDLTMYDPETKVSRRHARIFREGEVFLIEDLGSVNGTVINSSVRLNKSAPRVLAAGDELKVGSTILKFTVG
jgi:serine/threonine-protein kinase